MPGTDASTTRLIALGAAPLMEGFALVGFETYPNADAAQLERLLAQLVKEDARALVLVAQALARSEGPWLARVRNEGGRIIVTELPELHQPEAYHPLVEDLVTALLGPNALEDMR